MIRVAGMFVPFDEDGDFDLVRGDALALRGESGGAG